MSADSADHQVDTCVGGCDGGVEPLSPHGKNKSRCFDGILGRGKNKKNVTNKATEEEVTGSDLELKEEATPSRKTENKSRSRTPLPTNVA